MSKVILQGYIVVEDSTLSAVVEELPNHIALTLQESGCLVFKVSQSSDDKNRFDVYEEFRSESAFQHHQERVRDSRWGKVSQSATRHFTTSVVEASN